MTDTSRSWPRDPALEERILAAIDRSPDGLDVSELADALTDYSETVVPQQFWSRVQLSCWDLANEGKIRHAHPSQRYIRAKGDPCT